jgi:CarboxypepD_reg-like domain
MRKIILILLNFLFVSIAVAQKTSITGKITDNNDKSPIAGATIVIKGTVNGTVANAKGDFILNTSQKPPFTIRVSAIGFLQKEIEVKDSEPLNIGLGESVGTLEEV